MNTSFYWQSYVLAENTHHCGKDGSLYSASLTRQEYVIVCRSEQVESNVKTGDQPYSDTSSNSWKYISNIKFADDWMRTADLCYQLSLNHYQFIFIF